MRGSLRFLKRSERGDGVFWGGIGKGFFFVRVFLEVPGVGMVTGVGKRSYELLTLIIVKFDRQPDAIAPFLLSSTAALDFSPVSSLEIFIYCHVIGNPKIWFCPRPSGDPALQPSTDRPETKFGFFKLKKKSKCHLLIT